MSNTPIEVAAKHVTRIVITPLREEINVFTTAEEATGFSEDRMPSEGFGDYGQYEVRIEFSNGDKIDATYNSKERVNRFIEFFAK